MVVLVPRPMRKRLVELSSGSGIPVGELIRRAIARSTDWDLCMSLSAIERAAEKGE